MQRHGLRAARVKYLAWVSLVIIAATPGIALGQEKIPAPLNESQIASRVAASLKITHVPKALSTPLSAMGTDHVGRYFPTIKIGCYNYAPACTFGNTRAKKTIVLLGDSHAAMWAPALIPAATAVGYKVVVLWFPNCPAADVTPFNLGRGALDLNCPSWHRRIFADIAQAHPTAVILSEATSFAQSDSSTMFSSPEWQSGVERTISAVSSKATKVVVMGDIPVFTESPSNCLARNPAAVQQCSTPLVNLDPKLRQLTSAEKAAALARGVKFVSPTSLLCASSCSPLVGNQVTYFDNNHVSASYAATVRSALWVQISRAMS